MLVCALASGALAADGGATAADVLAAAGSPRGLCVLVGDSRCELAEKVARASELMIYVHLDAADKVPAARARADNAALLGRRIWVDAGVDGRIGLADNLADVVVVPNGGPAEAEALRVLHPGGKAILGGRTVVKPAAEGADEWTHPYHGPDNNPQSSDRLARWPYRTQFLADPWFAPMPQVSVAAGGRVFKLFGHFTSKIREWPLMHKLMAINGYNGAILWERELKPGFLLHRNTVVATAETLYVADDTSCKLLDAATGRQKGEIAPDPKIAGGRCWKWMALDRGTLYALIGGEEPAVRDERGKHTGRGWGWPNLDRSLSEAPVDPEAYPWMIGTVLLAIDAASGEVRWHRAMEKPIDGRAVCLRDGRIYAYSHPNFLACLDAATGKDLWRTADRALLEAIGPHYKAQFAITGYASSCYMKATDKALYFAGPQRTKLVAASAADGKLLWTAEDGNAQLVIRDGAVYAMGAWDGKRCRKFDAMTGQLLRQYPFARVSCTRATGSADSVFCRGFATFRLDAATDQVRIIGPMRPPCNDGVMIAHGLLYWGPWMCDCNLSLIGSIALAPAGDSESRADPQGPARLESNPSAARCDGRAVPVDRRDWPTYRKDNARSAGTDAAVAAKVEELWRYTPKAPAAPTAAVAAAGQVFVAFDDGVVVAMEAATGRQRWRARTGGAVHFPPTIDSGRAYVGSADGWVYCLNAATGERLWRYRVAPVDRKIPVYDRLSSTWPVASGVLVAGGVAYAAAGIAHYDGTHLVALDATTGQLKWHNGTSGTVSTTYQSGVSVQGHLLLDGGRLYLAGGNSISPAAYDAATGRCLERVRSLQAYKGTQWSLHRGRDLYLGAGAVVPSGQVLYSPAVDLDRPLGTAEDVMHASNGKAIVAKELGQRKRAILRLPAGADPFKPAEPLWRREVFVKNFGIVAAANAAVVTGLENVPYGDPARASVTALDLSDGRPLWKRPLPAPPVPWGLAVDRDGRVLVSLRDGRVLCLGARSP